jgi:hypothetical protein
MGARSLTRHDRALLWAHRDISGPCAWAAQKLPVLIPTPWTEVNAIRMYVKCCTCRSAPFHP